MSQQVERHTDDSLENKEEENSTTDTKIHELSSHYNQMMDELNKAVIGRYDSKVAVLLGLATGYPTLLVGDRGIAKTMLIELLPRVIEGLSEKDVFVIQASEHTDVSEVFGTIDVQKLAKGEGYELITQGFLPSAKINFIDEIFYTTAKLRSTLLRAINEKIYKNYGKDIKLPWIAFFSASNKVDLEEESDKALLDRFPIRGFITAPALTLDNVPKIADELLEVLKADVKSSELKKVISIDEILQTRNVVSQIVQNFANSEDSKEILEKVLHFIGEILSKMEEDGIESFEEFYKSIGGFAYVSTRTLKRLVYIASTIALLRGSPEPTYLDFLLAVLFVIPVDMESFNITLEFVKKEWNDTINKSTKDENVSDAEKIEEYINVREIFDELIKHTNLLSTGEKEIERFIKKVPLTQTQVNVLIKTLPYLDIILNSKDKIDCEIAKVYVKENGEKKRDTFARSSITGSNAYERLSEIISLLSEFLKPYQEAKTQQEKEAIVSGLYFVSVLFKKNNSEKPIPLITLLDAISLLINNFMSVDRAKLEEMANQFLMDYARRVTNSISKSMNYFSNWEIFKPFLDYYGMEVPNVRLKSIKGAIEKYVNQLLGNMNNYINNIYTYGEKLLKTDYEISKILNEISKNKK